MIGVTVKRVSKHDVSRGVLTGTIKAVEEVAIAIEGQATINAPKDTGILKASITRKVNGLTAAIGTNLIYAMIQEFGGTIRAKTGKYLRFKNRKTGRWVTTESVKIPAANNGQGYMRPAAETVRRKITAIAGKYIRIGIRRS